MVFENLSSKNLLVDAFKFYTRGDARAHEFLNIIIDKRNDMLNAVQGCLEQAVLEEDPNRQKLYLQAGCFGKKFYPGIAIEEYQSTCRQVRVMNLLRQQNIEPDTSVEEVVKIFLSRRQFELALWVIQYLRVEGGDEVRKEWSEYLVKQHRIPDDEVAAKVQSILGRNPQVSYADIATKAIESHRSQLAIKLLDKESHSIKQLPLLLNLKQYDRVLAQALSSCDSNLIHMAIFKLRESIPSQIPFLELLRKHPLALKYYSNYLTATDMDTLILLSHKENSEDELLWCLLDDRIETAHTVAKKAKRGPIVKLIEDARDLKKIQQNIKQPPPAQSEHSTWVGMSLSDSIINLLAMGQTAKAKDIQKKFLIPDSKFSVLEQIATDSLPELEISPT